MEEVKKFVIVHETWKALLATFGRISARLIRSRFRSSPRKKDILYTDGAKEVMMRPELPQLAQWIAQT